MNHKERVLRALEFRSPDRVPVCTMHVPTVKLSDFLRIMLKFNSDIFMTSVVYRKKKISKTTSIDPWGAVWESLGNKGEVIESPLKDWSGLNNLKIPDYLTRGNRYFVKFTRLIFKRKYLLGNLPDMIFSLCHYLRGYDKFMEDFYFDRENLEKLVSIIVEHNLKLIDFYADCGLDAVMGADDLGLQHSLMISPEMWREIFKPGYKAMIERAHLKGMKFILHSCGYIIDIIDDFIEIGLDSLQCDQQDNMGIDNLNDRFGGRIAFFSPTDIQTTLSTNDGNKILEKARKLKATLGAHNGGFMGKVYPTPKDIGATEKSIYLMLKGFRENNN